MTRGIATTGVTMTATTTGTMIVAIGGLLIHSDNDEREVKPYAKAEATVTIPALAELGAGARISGDRMRIYGTAAFDLLPKLKLKGNLGDHYVAIGIMGQF